MKKIHENKYYQIHFGVGSTDTDMFDTLEEAQKRRSEIIYNMLQQGFEPKNVSIYLHNIVRIFEDEILITEVKTTSFID